MVLQHVLALQERRGDLKALRGAMLEAFKVELDRVEYTYVYLCIYNYTYLYSRTHAHRIVFCWHLKNHLLLGLARKDAL